MKTPNSTRTKRKRLSHKLRRLDGSQRIGAGMRRISNRLERHLLKAEVRRLVSA